MCDKDCLKKVPYGIRKEEILKNTEKDNRVRRFMAPTRVVWKTDSDKASVTGEEALFEARPKQIRQARFRRKCGGIHSQILLY